MFSGFTMVMPFLPLYLQQLDVKDEGQNAIWSGILIAASPFLAALLGPLWGWLADRYGLRKMALRAMLGLTVSWIIFGLATHVSHLLIARIVGGLFGGYNPLLVPLVTAGCPPEQQGKAIGTVQSTRVASIAVGPVVGGFLAGWIGIRGTVYLTACLSFVSLLLFYLFYRAPAEPERLLDGESTGGAGVADLLKHVELLPLVLILALSNFFDRGLAPIIPLMVLRLGTPAAEVAWVSGLIFSGGAVASTLASWLVGRLAVRWKPESQMKILAWAGLIFCLPLAASNSNWALGVFRFLLGLTAGGVLTAGYLIANRRIPKHAQASGMAVLTSGALLGNALGPFLFGILASFGLRISLASGIPIFLLLLWLVQKRPRSVG